MPPDADGKTHALASVATFCVLRNPHSRHERIEHDDRTVRDDLHGLAFGQHQHRLPEPQFLPLFSGNDLGGSAKSHQDVKTVVVRNRERSFGRVPADSREMERERVGSAGARWDSM